ncbi:MAG: asparagine--tRNA ligase [Desulfurococcales archaeon]|nr:asparagine--tRNA ligase [Desulfurococcales archaeon]
MSSYYSVIHVLKKSNEGDVVNLRGWVYRLRWLGGKVFIVLRDHSGIIQCVVDKDEARRFGKEISELGIEASIIIGGTVRFDKRAPGGKEIKVTELRVVGVSNNFPIKGGEGIDYLLDNRHLWIRSRRLTSIFKVKHTMLKGLREYFSSNEWWEVTPPILTMSAVEGGATLFPVDFFGRKAYLSQSAQFYLETLIFSLEKVWSVTTSFRAERSRTRRHLYEYTHLEAEAAWMGMKEMMTVVEEMVKAGVKKILDERLDELETVKRDITKLEQVLSNRFDVITYDEAVELLREKGVKIEWGEDFGADEERVLTQQFDTPIFVTMFPRKIKSFYMKVSEDNPELVYGFDLLAPEGYGEIVGGSVREDKYDTLLNRIREEELNPKDYEWYLDLRKYGSVPHSGFGLGIERMLMWISGLDHIRDATPYPRFRDRLYP